MSDLGYYAYLLQCADGTLYAGWTTDIQKRLQTHNAGKASKYTRVRLPVTLAGVWSFQNRSEAMRYECWLKKLPREQKLQLASAVQSQRASV